MERLLPLAIFLSLGCTPAALPPPPIAPAPSQQPTPVAPSVVPSPVPSQASAPSTEPAPAPTAAEAAPPASNTTVAPLPAFEAETPYLPGQHPRPSGKMAASIYDEQLARWNNGGSSDPRHPSNRPNYHPAPRVVVDLKPLSRAVPQRAAHQSRLASAASLLAEARNQGYWPFRTCFELGLRDYPELNGQVVMRARVAVSGRVASARLQSTRLANRAVVDCVVRAAATLSFHKPPARRADIELSVKFWPGDARLPPRAEPTRRGFNVDALASVLATHQAELATCCAEALTRDAGVWGRLAFTLAVDREGRVSNAAETESSFPDREASACMQRMLSGLSTLPLPQTQFVYALRCGRPPAPPQTAPEPLPSEVPASPAPPADTTESPAGSLPTEPVR